MKWIEVLVLITLIILILVVSIVLATSSNPIQVASSLLVGVAWSKL